MKNLRLLLVPGGLRKVSYNEGQSLKSFLGEHNLTNHDITINSKSVAPNERDRNMAAWGTIVDVVATQSSKAA